MKKNLNSILVLLTLIFVSCQKMAYSRPRPNVEDGMWMQYQGFYYAPRENYSGKRMLSVCYNEKMDSVIIQADYCIHAQFLAPPTPNVTFAIVLPVSELVEGNECGKAAFGVYDGGWRVDNIWFIVNEFDGKVIEADLSLSCGSTTLENGRVRRKVLRYDEADLFFYPNVMKYYYNKYLQ